MTPSDPYWDSPGTHLFQTDAPMVPNWPSMDSKWPAMVPLLHLLLQLVQEVSWTRGWHRERERWGGPGHGSVAVLVQARVIRCGAVAMPPQRDRRLWRAGGVANAGAVANHIAHPLRREYRVSARAGVVHLELDVVSRTPVQAGGARYSALFAYGIGSRGVVFIPP